MDRHIRALRKEELLTEHGGWFDDENAERVLSWLVAAEDRAPVVFVGAGFTRNARDRQSAKLATSDQAPFWSEVASRLAGELGVDANRYDAPTLFEMYQEALGEAKLRDALRATLADSELVPGEAHKALAAYSCEAIVTLNCLDTLLDKACVGLRRVVVDSDLSTAGYRHDLIYLHGHRDFPDSWVMTRGQFEDFARKKPVIVARVRQLLAQHPWLLVGFGMTDPNFHSITRLLGLEMRSHQPLSLALMRDAPSSAERKHWHKLGFEIVSPNKKDAFADFLASVIPKLETKYSPTSASAKAYIGRGSSPAEKLQRFRQVFPTPIVDREAAYHEWRNQIKTLLTSTELDDSARAAEAAEQDTWPPAMRMRTGQAYGPGLNSLPAAPKLQGPVFDDIDTGVPFRPLVAVEDIQWLACLLRRDDGLVRHLADHFEWAVLNRLLEPLADELPLEVLALRLAKSAGWDRSNGGRLDTLLRAALASARKYRREKVERLLAREAANLKLAVPSPEEQNPEQPHLQAAKAGYVAFMDADFKSAAENYERAAKLAADAHLDFEEWVYTSGYLHARAHFVSPLRVPAKRVSADEVEQWRVQQDERREYLRQLSRRPAVERWIKQADGHSRAALQEAVERRHDAERFRETGGRGYRFNGYAHALWRAVRDIQTIFAPPPLQATYVEPLLALASADDIALVVPNVSKPREWLAEILPRPLVTLSERQSRDNALVDFVLIDDATLTQTEVVARVACLRELDDVLQRESVPVALEWLGKTAGRFSGRWVETAWGQRAIAADYWPACSAAVRWAAPPAACALVERLAEKFGDDKWEAVRALYGLPWHQWKGLLNEDTAKRFLGVLTQLLPTIISGPATRDSLSVDYALFTLLRLLGAGLKADRMTTEQVATWKAILQQVKAESRKERDFDESRRAGFLLERDLVGSADFPARDPAELFADWFGSGADDSDRVHHEEVWAALADVVDEVPALLGRLHAEVQFLLQDSKALQHYGLNPHTSYRPLVLLTKGLKHLQDDRPRIASFLVQLLAVAPSFMSTIAEVLVREWWEPASWDALMDLVVDACGGGGARADAREDVGLPTRRQVAVLGLFGEFAGGVPFKDTDPLVWQAMQGLALTSVNDARQLVANRAAFSVVQVAKDIEDESESKLYAAAIRRIATDPRVPVCSAVADAGPGLAAHAMSPAVRAAAQKALAQLETDDNAQVNTLLTRAKAAVATTNGTTTHAVSTENSLVNNG